MLHRRLRRAVALGEGRRAQPIQARLVGLELHDDQLAAGRLREPRLHGGDLEFRRQRFLVGTSWAVSPPST